MKLTLCLLPHKFIVCKTEYVPRVEGIFFLSRTEDEISLVCQEEYAPDNCTAIEHGWRALHVAGNLDFALTGILAGLTKTLADAGIPAFAISTYDTDYVLVKADTLDKALCAFGEAGYEISGI